MRVDSRAGSQELTVPLRKWGITVEECILPAGDVEIIGNGPGGRPLLVGIEVKKLPDLFQCIRNGRFADQLRGMKSTYEVNWLLIEGRWAGFEPRTDIVIRQGERWYSIPGRVTYQEATSWILTMCNAAGVLVWRTESQEESVAWLRAHELWWTSKEYEQHRAHLGFYCPPVLPTDPFSEPSLVQKVATILPGIGGKKAVGAAEFFGSVR